jgi:hypothetical protein
MIRQTPRVVFPWSSEIHCLDLQACFAIIVLRLQRC